EVRRLKALFREVDRRSSAGTERLLSLRQASGLVDHEQVGGKPITPDHLVGFKIVQPGEIVMNRMRASAGLFAAASTTGLVSPDYAVFCQTGPLRTDYFVRLFRTPLMGATFRRESRGLGTGESGFLRLYSDSFGQLAAPYPPEVEQLRIVRFLDHADREVRRYVRVRQRLVMLLEQQKGMICDRAVVRGIVSDISLKPSGLPWLGNVPEQWDVLSLRRRWEVVDCKHLTAPFVPEGVPLASVREAQTFDLDLAKANRTTQEYYEKLIGGGRAPRKGDVIYCRNVSVGASAFVGTDEPFAMGQDVCLIRSSTENCRFLNYVLHSPAMKRQLQNVLVGSTFDRINVAEVKNLTIAVPPRREQDEIVEHLDRTFAEIDAAIRSARRELVLVREFRERLVSDVITGRLDVRAAATALPEPDTGPDVLDDFGSAEDEVEGDADGVPVPDEADA
ncbi:MAG TPA: restriction endonuclease subunit S, partial [Thermoanaerobaculia bacterium]|nr:restriction endonuclease subunit S [Thermoanaerobaculia bacterium]